jgi:hypothetical protein
LTKVAGYFISNFPLAASTGLLPSFSGSSVKYCVSNLCPDFGHASQRQVLALFLNEPLDALHDLNHLNNEDQREVFEERNCSQSLLSMNALIPTLSFLL